MNNIQWFDHQKTILTQTRFSKNVGLFLDMGLGKTYLSCAIMERYGTPYNLCVVQKSKVSDFIQMFKEQGFNVIDATKKFTIQPGVIVINYELLWRRPELAQLDDFTLILDESSKIMHDTSKVTKFVLNKLHPEHVILCSGSPCNGKYENLYTQCRLLGYNVSKDYYWSRYVNYINDTMIEGYTVRHFKRVLGYRNIEELKSVLTQHGAVFMKSEEVIKLPESIDTTITVKNYAEYRQFVKDRITSIQNTEMVGEYLLTARLRLRQLSGAYNKDKLSALADLIESTGDRLIIFYVFKHDYEEIAKLCKDRPISYVNGNGRDLSAYETEENSITLIQFQSGAYGLNMQKCNKIIYFDPPESSDLYTQSRARIRRIGQARTCYYWHLIQHGIEEKIYQAIQNGKDYTDELFRQDAIKW